MACEDLGRYAGPADEFVTFAIGVDPLGGCQRVQVGRTSPGPIADDEVLARFVFEPAHTSRLSGEIDETVVLDAFKYGASVNRVRIDWTLALPALPALHRQGEALAERIRSGSTERPPQPERQYLGVLRFVADGARALSVDAMPARMRLYDTSLPDDPLHGDIVANCHGLSKVQKKELRVRLFLLVQKSGLFPSI
ncbi:hypothetical protein ACFOLJ_09820 [Rugamonas sp. CCM 8940]|uniref:hypothetical protein n=1 Tax=Rugamonas sp. CCM 8940 TaxID=2765359 RepID=UPI0018F468C3|nr:hypothetical protein [Rugamonas sp. CCM 8940]MBJ7313342.1 hypothetical protein [Rugamonas sp. CCM 8940]